MPACHGCRCEVFRPQFIVLYAIVSGFFLAGCGSGTGGSSAPSGPTPTITAISPNSAVAGGAAFTLTINGTNFVAASMVNFGGTARTTTFVSATQLAAAIPAAAIASASTLGVTVTNPAPDGGDSNAVSFATFTPTPTITAISPNSAVAGGAPFMLTITGTNFTFTTGWTVNFGATAIGGNTPGSSTQLRAFIPASAIASAGNLAVSVTPPGAGTSNAVIFTTTNGTFPVPTITYLSPSCAPVGAQSLTLEVNGSNFAGGSVVRWNGGDQPTTVFGGDGLIAQIPSGDIASAGTSTVTVFNPSPGGGSSNSSTFTVGTGAVSPQSIAVDSTGRFVYVANEGCEGDFSEFVGSVSMYAINPTTGALTSIGSPVAADFGAKSVTVDPSGKFAYVANQDGGSLGGGTVSMYTINPTTGALTSIGTIAAPCAGPPSPGSCAPDSVAVDPSGKFAYVANEGGFTPTSVSMYTINATTGALTSIGTIAAGGRATSVTVDPTGKFAYVADGEPNSDASPGVNVSMYTINPTTGALTSIGTIAAGLSPSSIAIDPSGKFAYVASSGSNNVSMYSINATTGALTSLGPIAAGTSPSSVALDPTGTFAYVVNLGSNNVSIYAINATTGILTSIGTIAAGSSPTSIAIDPSGKFAYVTNSDSNSVSMYSIDTATGALTLIGTIGT